MKCKKWLPVIAACPVISSSTQFGKPPVLPDRAQLPTHLWDKVHIIIPFNFIAKHLAFYLLAKVNCKQMSVFCIRGLILAFSSLINCHNWWTGILKKCMQVAWTRWSLKSLPIQAILLIWYAVPSLLHRNTLILLELL